jgi:MoaA/NifB/PqqE/SkfB family radical SAM enzyme
MNILKNYYCSNPFNYIEIHKTDLYTCCPSWLNTPICSIDKIEEFDNSDILKKIQNSVLDGTYSYCNKEFCPYLSELIYNGIPRDIIKLKSIPINYNKRISFCFDGSCNLACPSCRKTLFFESEESVVKIDKIINDISKIFGKITTSLSISGTCDPFVSKTFRNFLINFDKIKFPRLKSIYLQTNGLLLNEEMWNKISKVNNIITMAVSVDAATKETYSIVRGGNFNTLIENLKFISTLKCKKTFSFVVQDTNYKEMESFFKLISNLNPVGSYNIYFSKINNWGTYTDEEFRIKEIFKEYHPDFNLFLEELSKITLKYNVVTNMNDIIEKYSLNNPQIRLI